MLSFIIPAHDEARLIAATIAAMHDAAQALQLDYEIVVVDDASTDDTATIAEQAGARVNHAAHRQIAAARNAGAAVARGETFVFVDADTLIDANVVRAALNALSRGAIGGGATVRLQGKLAMRERMLALVVTRLLRLACIAPGCFLFCTREGFAAVGGFDTRYYAGEDVAISRALAGHGRFVILPQRVWTSDRKLRTFALADHARLMWLFITRGRRVLRSRDALALWYDKRRHDLP